MDDTTQSGGSLEALVAIGRRCGVDTSVEAVRRRFAVAAGPVSDATLVSIAAEIGLRARPLTVGWSDLPRFRNVLPAILRLRDGRALVLDALIDDPKTGR